MLFSIHSLAMGVVKGDSPLILRGAQERSSVEGAAAPSETRKRDLC
jgi:hypothetical protein